MNTDKIITEFQAITNKLSDYELERNLLFQKLKDLEKENNKLKIKQEKEKDSLLKLMYEVKITSNQDFITVINSIFKDKK
ncbi:unknown [Firmicutes bacterium CAG:822]|nr:unknown [Firmicutes bacterium CAG:822]